MPVQPAALASPLFSHAQSIVHTQQSRSVRSGRPGASAGKACASIGSARGVSLSEVASIRCRKPQLAALCSHTCLVCVSASFHVVSEVVWVLWVAAMWPLVIVAKMPSSHIDASAASCTCLPMILACSVDLIHPAESFCAVRQARCFCRQGLRINWVC